MLDLVGNPEGWFSHHGAHIKSHGSTGSFCLGVPKVMYKNLERKQYEVSFSFVDSMI